MVSSGWLLLVIPGLIWGASFLFIAQGLRALEPNAITFLRIAIGFITLSCFPAAREPLARADWPAVAWLGLLWFAFPLSMFPFAEQRVSSALTGMLNGANPLFATIVASLIARKAPSAGVAVGLAIGIGGAVLMGLPALNEGRSSTEGVLMIMAAMVSHGIALSIARSLRQKYGAMPVIWRARAVGLLLTAPLGIPDLMKIKWLPAPLASVVALGAFGTAIANVLMASAAGRFGAAKASGTTLLIPVVSLVLGVAILGESVVPLSLLGGVVCLAGAWLMKRAASH